MAELGMICLLLTLIMFSVHTLAGEEFTKIALGVLAIVAGLLLLLAPYV